MANNRLKIDYLPLTSLRPWGANPKSHDLGAIHVSIDNFSFRDPVSINKNNSEIEEGHGRVQALLQRKADGQEPPNHVIAENGDWLVPVLQYDDDEQTQHRYSLAHNRTTELGGFDMPKLADTLQDIATFDESLLEGTGYDTDYLNDLLAEYAEPYEGLTDPDAIPEEVEPRCNYGELWRLGDHRLLCGDATKREDVERLMDGEKAGILFTSPPYLQQRDYTKTIVNWDSLMEEVFGNISMLPDGQVLVNLGLVHRKCEWLAYWNKWIDWMKANRWRPFGWYVWDQGAGLPGDWNGRFGPSFEFIFHFNKKALRPIKWMETKLESQKSKSRTVGFQKEGGSKEVYSPHLIGQLTKVPDSVVRVSRNSVMGSQHPAAFPIGLSEYIIQSWPGMVYDPFAGSGTNVLGCERLNRKCCGMEIEPKYCDVTIERWEQFTGNHAERIDG